MKKFLSLLLALTLVLSLVVVPARAAGGTPPATPEITGLTVNTPSNVNRGDNVTFTISGTPAITTGGTVQSTEYSWNVGSYFRINAGAGTAASVSANAIDDTTATTVFCTVTCTYTVTENGQEVTKTATKPISTEEFAIADKLLPGDITTVTFNGRTYSVTDGAVNISLLEGETIDNANNKWSAAAKNGYVIDDAEGKKPSYAGGKLTVHVKDSALTADVGVTHVTPTVTAAASLTEVISGGKTTLTEALVYFSGAAERMGRVEDGTTISDFDPEEAKRKASLSASVVPVEYEGIKYNLIDAPGLFDFEAGEYEGIRAAESVLVCVSGRSGVTVGAEKAFQLARKNGKATMVFVSKCDLENANYFKILEDMKIKFGATVCPCVVPAKLDDGTPVYINLFSQKAFKYEGGKQVQVDLPDIGHRFQGLIEAMSEAIAETDDELMEKFFGGEAFTTEEIVEGMRKGVKDGLITPVFCGSAVNQQALDMLLYNMHKLLPSPEHNSVLAEDANGEPVELTCSEAAPTVAYVFKTVADPFVGKLSYLRVVSGKITAGASLVNARTGETEKMGKPLTVLGKKQTEAESIGAGDIGAVAKLVSAKTGDTLCDASRVVRLPAPVFPKPSLFMAVTVAKKGDEGKISSALARLMEEDPTLSYLNNAETHQQIIGGLGEQHLDVVKAKLKNKFGVEIGLEAPRIAYRESIRKACQKQGRHKKQTGGHGQFGDVVINFEPCDSEQVVFEEKVFGGSVPKNFFPAVEKGVRLAAEKGVLAGYPVVGLKATLLDGSYHPVDSSEMAFIMAAKLAYKAAMPEAGPVILEPIHTLKAHVPNDNTGDIMGDVTKRRGRVLGMEPDEDGLQTIIAEVPLAELANFTTFIRQTTQGRGWFTTEFARYEILPEMLVPAVVEQARKLGNLDESGED